MGERKGSDRRTDQDHEMESQVGISKPESAQLEQSELMTKIGTFIKAQGAEINHEPVFGDSHIKMLTEYISKPFRGNKR
jgi:hypothetical protein